MNVILVPEVLQSPALFFLCNCCLWIFFLSDSVEDISFLCFFKLYNPPFFLPLQKL